VRKTLAVILLGLVLPRLAPVAQPRATPNDQELKHAQNEVPKLAEVLDLKPGMIVADVGAGGGAWTIVMANWLGPTGKVYSTDIAAAQLAAIREVASQEGLTNVLVVEGAEGSTNLPSGCCDAIFMRDVYHHLRKPHEFNASLFSALRPGGRLAIVDFEPEPGSTLADGVAANRGGHGIPPSLVREEISGSGLEHVRTILEWPPGSNPAEYFLVLFRKP
jgi:predicted methyltransferase